MAQSGESLLKEVIDLEQLEPDSGRELPPPAATGRSAHPAGKGRQSAGRELEGWEMDELGW